MKNETILITGACGQLGTELVTTLRKYYKRVLATDLKDAVEALGDAEFRKLDVLHRQGLYEVIQKEKVTQVYHLAAILSATGEQQPELAWRVNMKGLRNVLEICSTSGVKKVFFPSTIAVFGSTTPRTHTPQHTSTEPATIYGISKLAGELWCQWYFLNKNLDVRSLRYPGLISYKTKAGGGTTDYAVDIFFAAVKDKKYNCFLEKDTVLPMMYMPDAVRGTIELMEAPAERISVRTAYNFAGFSCSPAQIAVVITRFIPEFQITYAPDFRQKIADSWPQSIDDQPARNDWGWLPEYDLDKMVEDMLFNLLKTKEKHTVLP
ncbi:MAG: NAD-dependent epimerase/dehydratase family protein [Chitinophagales bacterium]|nr:NAD-dependent epimerase/dehydratase family protein [Chitinophagales bacterium]MDW8274051.1 NAD-dependent epimerase/dehydratase family protein [Chitinophagales bacterium]